MTLTRRDALKKLAAGGAGAAATVFWVWRRGWSLPVRAAILLAATPLSVPVALFYDLVLSGVALAWLVRWGQRHGVPAWLRTGVIALYIAALLTGNFGPGAHLVVTPLFAFGVFALTAAAAWHEAIHFSPAPCGRG